jgi:hypothetical protein
MTAKPPIFPIVSNHAILRFLERVHGVDVESVRKRILTPLVIEAVKAGATRITVEGVRFIIKNGVIVTAWEGEDVRRKSYKVRKGQDKGKASPRDDARAQIAEREEGDEDGYAEAD